MGGDFLDNLFLERHGIRQFIAAAQDELAGTIDAQEEIPAIGRVQAVRHVAALFFRAKAHGEGAVRVELRELLPN